MESKKLEALLMAVDLGSFTKAAEVLGYTQSGLTHMMNSLEKEVGFTLLERGRSGVRLTEEGERIAPAVREFLQANARLDSVIEQVASSRTEIIRVSAYASIAMHWPPGIIQRFREECPDVDVDIRMADHVDVPYELLAQGKMDAILVSPAGRGPVRVGASCRRSHVCRSAEGFRHAGHDRLPACRLRGARLHHALAGLR